ncbi:hypothetical protein ACHAWF_003638 [Thalassiosira exigua]
MILAKAVALTLASASYAAEDPSVQHGQLGTPFDLSKLKDKNEGGVRKGGRDWLPLPEMMDGTGGGQSSVARSALPFPPGVGEVSPTVVQVWLGSDRKYDGSLYDVKKGYMHPDYNGLGAFDYHVLILTEEVVDITSVLLNNNIAYPTVGDTVVTMGWGLMGDGTLSDDLMAVELKVLDNNDDTCGVSPDLMCLFGGDEGKDSCGGDSGELHS